MLGDYLCIERCRQCGDFVRTSAGSPFSACAGCWPEFAAAEPVLDWCNYAEHPAVLVASGAAYSGLLKKLIYKLKYDKDKAIIHDLSALTMPAMQLLLNTVPSLQKAVLVPIPLHWIRFLTRGYNQAEMLAEAIASPFKLRVDVHLLSRRRSTTAQHGLGKLERHNNIVGAFRVTRWAADGAPPVVLVDDLFTSGSTIGEAAAVLRKHGFQHVYAVTAARATLESEPHQSGS